MIFLLRLCLAGGRRLRGNNGNDGAEKREGLFYVPVCRDLGWKPLPYNCADASGMEVD
jgi:hypothetical protein